MLNSVDTVSGVSIESTSPNDAAQLDIKEFIHTQLKENTRDRLFMLNIERDLVNFIKNQKIEYHKFQAMNPYYRMLTHRICEYFGLGHNLDNLKQSVIVFKIAEKTTLPTVTFQTIINTSEQKQQEKLGSHGSESGSDSSNSLTPNTSSNNLVVLQEPKIEKKQILKRDTNDQENVIRNKQLSQKAVEVKPKTFEEKSAEYNRIKNRIFNNLSDNSDTDKASNQTVQSQETEIKQYRILNRTGKSGSEAENGENGPSNTNQKTNGQKKAQLKPKQTVNGAAKKPVQTKNFATPAQVVQPNYRQMVPQFATNQFVYMNQNGNYQQQLNRVIFTNMPHAVANGAYQLMANQTSGLVMSRAPFLQIPQVQTSCHTNSPARPSPNQRPKLQTHMPAKASDRIKNIKFQVYNLSADLTRAKLNELLEPYIFKMEILDKKTNAIQSVDDGKSSLLDEASIDIFIEFDNFDKIEEAFKDLNLNGGPQSTSPFLIKPVC